MMVSWYSCQESNAILPQQSFHTSSVVFNLQCGMLPPCLSTKLKDSLSDMLDWIFIPLFSLLCGCLKSYFSIWDPTLPNPVTKDYVFPEVLLD
jgi:hypothetical protein